MDSLFQTESYTVVETESGLVRSDSLTVDNLADIVPKPFVTNYPALFRLGASKRIEGFGLVTLDLVTGFQDHLWSSRGWQLAAGVELLRMPSFPIRMGVRYGGPENQQLGLGFGAFWYGAHPADPRGNTAFADHLKQTHLAGRTNMGTAT